MLELFVIWAPKIGTPVLFAFYVLFRLETSHSRIDLNASTQFLIFWAAVGAGIYLVRIIEMLIKALDTYLSTRSRRPE